MRRLAHWLLVLALSFSIGLHWAVMQSTAWVGMVISYSQEGTLAEAITKTFDGKHPCARCNQVQKGQETGKKSEVSTLDMKVEMIHEPVVTFVSPPRDFWKLDIPEQEATTRPERPSLLPPRLA